MAKIIYCTLKSVNTFRGFTYNMASQWHGFVKYEARRFFPVKITLKIHTKNWKCFHQLLQHQHLLVPLVQVLLKDLTREGFFEMKRSRIIRKETSEKGSCGLYFLCQKKGWNWRNICWSSMGKLMNISEIVQELCLEWYVEVSPIHSLIEIN